MNQTISNCCYVYNKLLERKINVYQEDQTNISQFDLNKIIKEFDVPIHSQVKQNISKRISEAFNNFFRRVKEKKGKAGFPRFKNINRYKSITYPQAGSYNGGVKFISNKKLYVSKIGKIKIVLHREIKGKIKTLTIKRNADKWYAIFSCEGVIIDKIKPIEKRIGIDVGIEDFATLSNGEVIENPQFFRNSEKKLVKLQRRLSKKKKGSNNRKKAILKVARQHEKIFNQRNDFLHNQTTKIVRRFKTIAVEKLNIKGMIKNRYLAKSIADASWGSFIQILTYKVENTGGKVEKVNPRYTSQTCSNCGHRQKMPLNKRIFKCKECDFEIGRDVNSAININTSGHGGIHACGDTIRPSLKARIVEAGNYRKNA